MRNILLFFAFFLTIKAARSQQAVNLPYQALSGIASRFDSLATSFPVEKMYLHFDKPYYASGDTAWFKVYLFTAGLKGSPLSGVMYIELANDDNKVVKRMAFPVVAGLSWGDIPLDTAVFKEDNYTLRAYTNWMLNFGTRYIYTHPIRIIHNMNNPWLGKMALTKKGEDVEINLRLTDTHLQPLADMPVQLKLQSDNKKIHVATLSTSIEGMLNFHFTEPANKIKNLSLWVGNPGKNDPQILIPIKLNLPQDIDLQFMPEGGNWIPDEPVRMAFKAIGEDGKGIDVAGDILNREGEIIGKFKSSHLGMGSCILFGQAGETYTAHITQPLGNEQIYPLPPVRKSGTSLQVHHIWASDSFLIQIAATPDIANKYSSFLLMGQANGEILYQAVIKVPAQGIGLKVSSALFPSGIARLSLLDMTGHPLNERIVFIHHHDKLKLSLQGPGKKYAPHDSIALKLHVTDSKGNPVRGSFSLAVTDNAQVKADNTDDRNIINYMYLSSYLKGNIEAPGYYFSQDSFPETDMENLLLTQGWVGYDWPETDDIKPPAYAPEPEFEVKGKVLNLFNKPVNGARVLLFSSKPAFTKDALTNTKGIFVFNHLPPFDTAAFFLQAFNKRGKSRNVGIELDEFKAPDLPEDAFPINLPWNINTDTVMLRYATGNAIHQQETLSLPGHVLKEVVVTANKIIRGSYNMNGPGGADEVMDEKEILSYGKVSLFELLMKRFKKIQANYYDIKSKNYYKPKGFYFGNIPVVLLIDGNNLNRRFPFDELLDKLKTLDAQDFKGIEVMQSMQYIARYNSFYAIHPGDEKIYMEITSRSGKFLFEKQVAGTYTYRPIPFAWPGKFYSPRYSAAKKVNMLKDLRSTIYWNPDIETDSAGNALIYFFAADNPSNYTIIGQGSDMDGHVGYLRKKIAIKE